MRLNEHTAVSTLKVLLVPYSKHHVPTYHEWMQDEELQKATASEPLSSDEEYHMQQSWRTDKDKLTFIVCLPSDHPESASIASGQQDAPDRMIGDVNLFLVDDDEHDLDDEEDSPQYVVGELEVMIARKDMLRHGFGRAALQAFIAYIKENLTAIVGEEYADGTEALLSYLRVKIGAENVGSIALFESLGFKRMSEEPNVFGEVEFRRNIEHMSDHCDGFRTIPYVDAATANGV